MLKEVIVLEAVWVNTEELNDSYVISDNLSIDPKKDKDVLVLKDEIENTEISHKTFSIIFRGMLESTIVTVYKFTYKDKVYILKCVFDDEFENYVIIDSDNNRMYIVSNSGLFIIDVGACYYVDEDYYIKIRINISQKTYVEIPVKFKGGLHEVQNK